MLKNWLLAGAVVLGGSALTANQADAFGHHHRGHGSGCCNPCGYVPPVVVHKVVVPKVASGGCCGPSLHLSGHPGHAVSGHRGAAGLYTAGMRGVSTGVRGVSTGVRRGVSTGMRGFGTGVRGVSTGVRGVVGGFPRW